MKSLCLSLEPLQKLELFFILEVFFSKARDYFEFYWNFTFTHSDTLKKKS